MMGREKYGEVYEQLMIQGTPHLLSNIVLAVLYMMDWVTGDYW